MKKIIFILMFQIILTLLCSETIVLIDGREFQGEIIGKEGPVLYLNIENETIILQKAGIKSILEYDNIGEVFKKPDYMDKNKIIGMPRLIISDKIEYNMPYLRMLPISFLSFILMYDYIADIVDINDQIDDIKKSNEDQPDEDKVSTSKLENKRNRLTFCSMGFAVVGIVNTFFSFKRVAVEVTPGSISLSYKF